MNPNPNPSLFYLGIKVYIATPYKVPNQKLGHAIRVDAGRVLEISLSEKIRKEVDDWLETIFGCTYVDPLQPGEVVGFQGGLLMNQDTWGILNSLQTKEKQ